MSAADREPVVDVERLRLRAEAAERERDRLRRALARGVKRLAAIRLLAFDDGSGRFPEDDHEHLSRTVRSIREIVGAPRKR
jgi:hypothetical protein